MPMIISAQSAMEVTLVATMYTRLTPTKVLIVIATIFGRMEEKETFSPVSTVFNLKAGEWEVVITNKFPLFKGQRYQALDIQELISGIQGVYLGTREMSFKEISEERSRFAVSFHDSTKLYSVDPYTELISDRPDWSNICPSGYRYLTSYDTRDEAEAATLVCAVYWNEIIRHGAVSSKKAMTEDFRKTESTYKYKGEFPHTSQGYAEAHEFLQALRDTSKQFSS